MLTKLHRQTKRIFSSLALVLLLAQNMLPLGQLFSSPTLAQAVESPVTPVPFESVLVELTAENNFEVSVQSEVDVPLVLAYTHGELQEGIEATAVVADGVAKASQYAGTCSADDCTPHEVTEGTLTLVDTDQVFLFTVSDEELWLTDGKKASVASVEISKNYVAPQNDAVSITFSELPVTPGSLSIEEVTLSDEQVAALGATSNIAYDITSDMENGTFAYDLQLPLPEGMDGDSKVVFAESVEQLTSPSVQAVNNEQVEIDTNEEAVNINELTHFTVFVVVYDSMPAIMPGSSPSLGYQATATSEFGDHLSLAGVERNAARVTVELNSWACENDFTLVDDQWVPDRASTDACETTPGSSYAHPITLNIYSVDTSGPVPTADTLVASKTITANVPFRPSYDSTQCGDLASNTPFGGRWFDPVTGTCSNGYNFDLVFDLEGEELPDQVITTIAFNTQSYGQSPIGVNGPYNSLNFSVPNVSPSVGTNVNPDDVFWKTSYAANYTDGGVGGVNVLRQDTNWTGYVPLIKVETIAPPVVTIDDAVAKIVNEQACGLGAAWNDDGLKVDITNWAPGYKLMGRYFTQGGSFVGWFDLSTWASVVVSGNNASFFVANSGNSAPGNAGWEVKVVDDNGLDISNVDTLSYYITTDQSSAACGGVEISVCKEDDNGQPLSGWELILSGREEIADTTFNTLHSTGVTIPGLTAGNFYQVEVSGTWNNGSLETRDAFYGAGIGPNVGNLDPINTGVYDPRIVKVVLDDTPSTLIDFPSWWGAYTPTNTYSTIYEATDSDLNVRLWDFPIGSSSTSWYNDNNGQLTVKVYELTGSQVVTTGQNGCGEIQGVVGGQHYLSEVPQSNWQYVSGGGPITASSEATKFTIVNKSLIPVVEPELADVTVCKEDTSEVRLPGWQVQLYNPEASQSQSVTATTGVATALTGVAPGDYILRASGQYTYRSTVGAEFSDAGWSKRDPGDAVYGGAFVPWVNVMTFPNPNTGWLGVMVNGDSNWGSYFNPSHVYARSLENYAGGDISLQILDDQYGDNVGGVTVDLHEGYTGVTGQDGCVTFADVPYGEYQLGETMMMGWQNQSGIGGVEVDSETEAFTLVNASTQTPEPSPSPSPTPEPTPTPQSVVLSASKVLCESEADLPNAALGGAITATTAQEWVDQSDGNCQIVSEWPFQWSPAEGGTFGAFQVDTTSMSEPWQSFVAGEVTIPLSASTSGRFEVREVFPEDDNDYIPFTNDSSVSAQLACTGDGAGYDNWEWVNNPQAGSTYHCVAFNALVGEPESSPTPTTSPSPTPGPTVEPEIVPTPTPEPTPTSTPAPQVLGSSTESNSSNGNPSAPQCTAQKPNGAPIVQVTASGDNQVTLTWTAVSPVTHYGIFFNEVGGAEYGANNVGNVTSYTVTNLNPGATYNFEVFGVNDCAPGDRSSGVSSGAVTGGPVTGGPIGPAGEIGEVLGEEDDLTPEEQQAQDEQAAAEAAALAGQVAGVSDEICENQATPYLPLIFLLCMAVISLIIEFMVRRGLIKLIGHALVFGAGVALFYWLANCDCEAVTASTILMFLCTWFWVVALAQTLILRGVGYLFIQEE